MSQDMKHNKNDTKEYQFIKMLTAIKFDYKF